MLGPILSADSIARFSIGVNPSEGFRGCIGDGLRQRYNPVEAPLGESNAAQGFWCILLLNCGGVVTFYGTHLALSSP